MSIVKIKDKTFKTSISEAEIKQRIKELAAQVSRDLEGKNPLFLGVLNGSFIFAADLMREMTIPCEISFVKLASYQGTISTGKVKEVIGINEDLTGRTVVIVEDIVDTGRTLSSLKEVLKEKGANSIKVASLLDKPERRVTKMVKVDYTCFTIPDEFVVGYGLDYDQRYRNYPYIGVVEFDEPQEE